jgi:hypothetical protein
MRKPARQTLKIGKNPVAALVAKLAQSPIEKDIIIHDAFAPSVYFIYSWMHRADSLMLEPRSPAITLIQIGKSAVLLD